MRKIRISALVVVFSVATFYLTPVHRVMASGVQALASVLAGGTGRTSLTANTVLVGEGTSPVNQVGPGTAGQCLESNGAGVDPSFGTCATGAGAVYSQTSDITVGNTVTETSVITGATGSGSPTLSAGFFTAGKTIRVVVWGYHSATAAPTIEWKMKLGAVTVLDTTAVASNNSTNQEILAQGYITCRTTGAMGTFFSQGRYEELTHLDSQMVNTAAATVDTTASQLLDVTVQWGTAAIGNTVTVTNVSIEVVGGGGSGGSGNYTLISDQLLAAPAASVTFSAIPGTNKHLKLFVSAECSSATFQQSVQMLINGDAGNNYNREGLSVNNGSVSAFQNFNSSAATAALLIVPCASAFSTVIPSAEELTFMDYHGTIFNKSYFVSGFMSFTFSTQVSFATINAGGYWANTAAITSLALSPADASNFITGSRFTLYGLN